VFWSDGTERRVRPGIALAWGVCGLLLGLAGFWGFFQEIELSIKPPIRMNDARSHLDEWVSVEGIRFDCEQVFRFSSSDGKYLTTWVVTSSEDGAIAALARYQDHGDCRALPVGPIRARFKMLEGSGPLVEMRRQGIRIPETEGPTLEMELRLKQENEWVMLLFSAALFVMGMRAFHSGLKSRGQTAARAGSGAGTIPSLHRGS